MFKKTDHEKNIDKNEVDIYPLDEKILFSGTGRIKFKKNFEIWKCELSKFKKQTAFLTEVLSQEEKGRAEAFMVEKDRLRYVTARGVVRLLISEYLGKSYDKLCFLYGKKGKPYIICGKEEPCVYFNISHSENIILLCFSKLGEPGVDVEKIRKIDNLSLIVQKYFHSEEKEFFYSLQEELQKNMFFRIWTLKEAYLKACGSGIGKRLSSFSVLSALTRGDTYDKIFNLEQMFSFEPERGYFGGAVFLR